MALAVSIRFSFLDAKGKTSFTKIRVPNGFSISDYEEFAQGAAQTIANITGCSITGASVCIGLDLSGATLKTVVAATADIAQKAFFIFNTALQGFRAKFKIPTLDESVLVPNSDVMNQANVDVAAFTAAVENGIAVTGPATISPTDNRENDITALSSARELFRKT